MEANIEQACYVEKKDRRYYYTRDNAKNIRRRAVAAGRSSSAKTVTVSEKIEAVDCFDISKQGSLFALAVENKIVTADLNEQLRQPQEVGEHSAAVNTVRFTGEDFNLLSGDRTGIVKYWQLKPPLL